MIGIYKITSPSGKNYIGQSKNIKRRFNFYKNLNCKQQVKLYNSFLKYSVEKHIFTILCECEQEDLNERERYFQEIYDCVNNGLNCKLTETNKEFSSYSIESRIKMSESAKGRIVSQETRDKMKLSRSKVIISKETCEKISKAHKGKIFSEEHRLNLSKSMLGRKAYNGIKIINTNTGIIYDSIKKAADSLDIDRRLLSRYLNGKIKNKTNMTYENY